MLLGTSDLIANLITIAIGAAFTAVLGGLLVPVVKSRMDRRREHLDASTELVDALARDLWTYWKSAFRVAYYGDRGPSWRKEYEQALAAWDSDKSWEVGCAIQINVSRARRLLSPTTHQRIQYLQEAAVGRLDREIDTRRGEDWKELEPVIQQVRIEIDHFLGEVVRELQLNRRSRLANMDSTAKPDSDQGPMARVELATYLWEQYRYRHDLIWRLLFRVTVVASLLSIAPFTIDDLAKAEVGPWVNALPALALALVLISGVVLHFEWQLFASIDTDYTKAHDRALGLPEPESKKHDVFKWIIHLYPLLLFLLVLGGALIAWTS